MKIASVSSNQNVNGDILNTKKQTVITFDDNTLYINRSAIDSGSDDPLTLQERVINALVEHIEELNKKIPRENPFVKAAKEILAMSDEELNELFSKTQPEPETPEDPKKTICIDCVNARRTWSEELQKDGYIGCRMLCDESRTFDINSVEAAVVGTGWVDLRAYPFTASQGLMTNDMLVTCGTRKCPAYRKRFDM